MCQTPTPSRNRAQFSNCPMLIGIEKRNNYLYDVRSSRTFTQMKIAFLSDSIQTIKGNKINELFGAAAKREKNRPKKALTWLCAVNKNETECWLAMSRVDVNLTTVFCVRPSGRKSTG